jgi:hypothetical protein
MRNSPNDFAENVAGLADQTLEEFQASLDGLNIAVVTQTIAHVTLPVPTEAWPMPT